MVFSTVMVIRGFPITKEEMVNNGVEFPEDEENSSLFLDIEETIRDFVETPQDKKEVEVYGFPCCSKLEGKVWIVGKMVLSYERVKSSRFDNKYIKNCPLKKCEKYNMCDLCIGQTQAGWFNVIKIFDELVECPDFIPPVKNSVFKPLVQIDRKTDNVF